jgi:sensor histidine kinase YesM
MAATESINATTVLVENDERRERTRMRFYVLCQSIGWGILVSLSLFFNLRFRVVGDPRGPISIVCSVIMYGSVGLLITHYARRIFVRLEWKQLGWRALWPRVLAAAMLMSLTWTGITYGYTFVLCWIFNTPWTVEYSRALLFGTSLIQNMPLLCGWLCIYFLYHMSDRFNRSELERLRLATTVKEAELRALKSQVNPHFIFNSLNSLRALIDEEPARAREAVTQLANLLRYSLQSGQLETVPFEDELRIVNDYLALEQVRHEERLRVRLDVDPATLGLPIPPMLLQTLVENAVKYGISTRPEGGEISIVARLEDGALRLRVSNPGELGSVPTTAISSTGVGLRNAAERLRLLFGDRATLQLRATTPATVVAEAVLPLEPLRA